jgi:hypothetical protein
VVGLPGFVVLAVGEYGSELEVLIETTESVAGGPRCGVVATLHDRKVMWVRDLPAGGRPVGLVWFKRVWRCAERACPQRTWSETVGGDPAAGGAHRTGPGARRVGQDATKVSRIATDLGVGWGTVMRAAWEFGLELVKVSVCESSPVDLVVPQWPSTSRWSIPGGDGEHRQSTRCGEPAGVGQVQGVQGESPALGNSALNEPARGAALVAKGAFPLRPGPGPLVFHVADRQPWPVGHRTANGASPQPDERCACGCGRVGSGRGSHGKRASRH